MERDNNYYINEIKNYSKFTYHEEELNNLIDDLRKYHALDKLDSNIYKLIDNLSEFDAIDLIRTLLLPDILHHDDVRMFYHINDELIARLTYSYKYSVDRRELVYLLDSTNLNKIVSLIDDFERNLDLNDKAKYGLEKAFIIHSLTIYYIYFKKEYDYVEYLMCLVNILRNDDIYEYLDLNGVRTIFDQDKNNKIKYYACIENYFNKYLEHKGNIIR